MQTEEGRSNGQDSAAVAIEDNLYPLDSPEWTVEVGRGKNVLSVTFSKPDEKDHLDYESATQTRSKVVDGAIVDQGDRHSANSELFDRLVMRATLRRRTEMEPFKEYSADECRAFGYEVKDEAISRLSPTSEVVGGDDDAGLFEIEQPLTVRQLIGDPENPSYVLTYEMKPLSKSQRLDYDAAVQIKRRIEKRAVVLESETTVIRKSLKLFRANLISMDGVMVGGEGFTPEKREEFVKQVDGLFAASAIDAMIGFYRRGRD